MSDINIHIAIQNWNTLQFGSPQKPMRTPIKLNEEREKLAEITLKVIEAYGITADEVFTRTRKRHIVKPRQISIYLGSLFTRLTLNQIADYFSGQHHTSIIHSIKTVKNLMDSDKEYSREVQKLKISLSK